MDPSGKKGRRRKADEPTEVDPTGAEAAEEAAEAAAEQAADARELEEEGGDPRPPPEEEHESTWTLLRDTYFTFDRRTLGFARILMGFLFIMDLFRRTPDWNYMFATDGVLPNHVNLWRPQASQAFTILNAFSGRGELAVLWVLIFCTFFCVLVGYKTRWAQILSVVWVCGMDGRVLLIENGGYVVYNLLAMWTAWLPMGDRFSVDAMLASMRRKKERTEADLNDRTEMLLPEQAAPYRTILGLVLLIQLSAVYYFNVLHKTGPAWKNGTAVHYVLHVDRMVTPLVAHVRTYIPGFLIIFMTKVTLAFEAGIPVCLLSPLGRVWARRLAVVMINALHLGFGVVFVLGPFAWALCVFSVLLFGREDWEIAISTMRRAYRARVLVYDPASPGALLLCRLLKRMDRFELLTFRAEEGLATGFAIEQAGGERRTRGLALADIVAALPVGPAIAWTLRLPGPRHAADALLARMEGGRFSSFFGLRSPTAAEAARARGPSPLRRKSWRVLHVLHELGVAAMFAGAVNQAMVELWVVNRRIKVPQPEPLRILSHKFRFLQGWFMFSPNPVMDDGTLIVDAITIDGRHVDPFTGKEPFWDLTNARSMRHNQIWCDYFNRMHLPSNTAYREPMKEFMYRLPERTGNPNDAIVSGDVYWIQDMNPRWGEKVPYKYEKVKLFSFENRANAAVKTPAPPTQNTEPGGPPAPKDEPRPGNEGGDVAPAPQ